jgi:hypothetical protein
MKDLDGEVLAHLAEDLLLLLLDDLTGTMVRVDDVVADLEVDALRLARDLEVFDLLGCLGDGVLLLGASACRMLMSAGSGPRG